MSGESSTAPASSGSPKPRRTVTIRLSPREKQDFAKPLQELRELLRSAEIRLLVLNPEYGEQERTASKDTGLQIRIGERLSILLEEKASSQAPAEVDGEKADKIKKSLWKLLKKRFIAGWRLTVETVLEWLSKTKAG